MHWKEHFKLKEFGLAYSRPQDFVTLQHGPQILYVIWAALWLAYHLIWILIEAYWSLTNTPGKWMLLLTNLSYLALAFLTLIDFVCCLYVCCLRPDIANGRIQYLPWYIKLQWITLNICGHAAVQVTLLYWAMIATSTKASTINKHGINLVHILLLLMVSAKPIKFQHFYMAVLSSIFYIFVNVMYYLASGQILYQFLNWTKPGTTAVLSLLFIFVSTPLSHFLLFGIYKLRVYLYKKLVTSRYQNRYRKEKEEEDLKEITFENGLDKNRNSKEKEKIEIL
ncbi:Hypothetical predicted protein [Mytilus galloprovincialis]|uniref:Protein rolling stone n=1 Tax=Mytilus galloprovincialis TaxID=29158 RepID=A0A8B6GHT2_MYTGA|nr:Hypothetical predicted protein [Mytilus galloprovincialis]